LGPGAHEPDDQAENQARKNELYGYPDGFDEPVIFVLFVEYDEVPSGIFVKREPARTTPAPEYLEILL
jgi:hypothetical protein